MNGFDYSEVTVEWAVVEVRSPHYPVDSMLHALVIFLVYSWNCLLLVRLVRIVAFRCDSEVLLFELGV